MAASADMPCGELRLKEIRASLAGKRIGRRIEFLPSTTSTNDIAWQHLAEPDADGLVVFADHQSAGRGRHRRLWHSPRGASLLCSVALSERTPAWTSGQLSLLAGIAMFDAIRRTTDVVPWIKWPNDLMVKDRKLGGVLVESETRDGNTATVIGVGINCLQQAAHLAHDLKDCATSLEIESIHPIDRTMLATVLLVELDRRIGQVSGDGADELRREWLDRAHTIGRRVVLSHDNRTFEGTILDVDPTAALIVQLDAGGIRAFNAANTTLTAYGTG